MKRNSTALILLAVGIAGIIIALLQLADWWSTTRQAPAITATSTHSEGDRPSETAIPIGRPPFRVAADEPFIIELPTIGAAGYIQSVSLDAHNAIGVPSNINLAGWYRSSVAPGQPGLSIVDGHVEGKYMPGIFRRLGELKKSDAFRITYGNGDRKTFNVVSIATYGTKDAADPLFHHDPSLSSQLNLITCGGAITGPDHYAGRVIVVSQLRR